MLMYPVLESRTIQEYAKQTGLNPDALPPGTIASIITIILPILLQFIGKCPAPTSPPTNPPTPPVTGAAALIEHCKLGTIMARVRIRQQIRANGGLDAGMRLRQVENTILNVGSISTPQEAEMLAIEES